MPHDNSTKLKMTMLPPPVGSEVRAFGYHACSAAVGDQTVTIDWGASTSIGRVIEIHPERRDSSSLAWPCFRTDARYDGGMSGAPVFDQNNHLCGLVSTSMPPFEDGESYVSYVTLLWPMLAIEIDILRAHHAPGLYPALELARDGMIAAEHWEKVAIQRDATQRIVSATLHHAP